MIDLHMHLLPGIDDGPDTMAESVRMASAAWDAGVRTAVCTPHMIAHYPTDPAEVHAAVEDLRKELKRAAVPLEVLPGAEIAIDHVRRLDDEQLRLASLGGRGGWLLLEMPYQGWPVDLPRLLFDLELRGFRVVLAHPERADAVKRQPDRLRDIVGRGALVQLTAGSFTGDHGDAARRTAQVLLAGGLAHLLASDAHTSGWRRGPEIAAGLKAAADSIDVHPQTLGWMVNEGPAAILAGGPVRPPRIGRALRQTPLPERPAGRPRGAPAAGGRGPRPAGRPSGRPPGRR